MTKVDTCEATDCLHNKNYKCKLPTINISGAYLKPACKYYEKNYMMR